MDPLVTTSAGAVRGALEEGCFSFLGIPYAAPPIGELRFAAPEPHPPWDGIRDAMSYGATAAQPAQDFTLIPEPALLGENCLTLNVFTPALDHAALPVMVWIHGGGFLTGCSASPWYRGESFNRDGVVVVSLNYRLGVEGFGIIDGAPANRGVLDWVAALTWVQDNIRLFGGDPGRVTIAGQSAGAVACVTLMAVPRAKGLFRQVIAMSGSGHLAGSLPVAADASNRVADTLGIKATLEDFAAISTERLIDAQTMVLPLPGGAEGPTDQAELANSFIARPLVFAPVPDGDVLPEHPVRALAGGAGEDVPLLIGTTSEEFTGLARARIPLDTAGTTAILATLGLDGPAAAEYAAAHGSDTIGQALTDRVFRIPARRTAASRQDASAGTWVYEFGWRSPALDGAFGAGHCMDVPFVFDRLEAEGTFVLGDDPPQSLATAMHGAWVGFITTGDPGWAPYAQANTVKMFAETSGTVADPLRPLLDVWADLT